MSYLLFAPRRVSVACGARWGGGLIRKWRWDCVQASRSERHWGMCMQSNVAHPFSQAFIVALKYNPMVESNWQQPCLVLWRQIVVTASQSKQVRYWSHHCVNRLTCFMDNAFVLVVVWGHVKNVVFVIHSFVINSTFSRNSWSGGTNLVSVSSWLIIITRAFSQRRWNCGVNVDLF